jgi:hypothetical protein
MPLHLPRVATMAIQSLRLIVKRHQQRYFRSVLPPGVLSKLGLVRVVLEPQLLVGMWFRVDAAQLLPITLLISTLLEVHVPMLYIA